MNLGVRFSTSDSGLAMEFAHALTFWATIVDMEWYKENSQECSIQVIDGDRRLFRHAEVARAQFADRPAFQGWIAFNPKVTLPRSEQYRIAVHELGHVLGLPHNPSSLSVMYYLHLDGPAVLDSADLAALAAHHKIHAARLDSPMIVTLPSRMGEVSVVFQESVERSLGVRFQRRPRDLAINVTVDPSTLNDRVIEDVVFNQIISK